MKIGVLSDSHDHLTNIKKAIDLFVEARVDKIVHCGDMVAPFIIRAMGTLENAKQIEVIGIYGNNDGERAGLRKVLKGFMEIKGDFYETTWDQVKIAVYHGTELKLLDALIQSKLYNIIFCGHTHQLRVETVNGVLVVNPGETCGYLTGRPTCVIVDLKEGKNITKDNVQIIDLDKK
jgi:putative phosphoesterase